MLGRSLALRIIPVILLSGPAAGAQERPPVPVFPDTTLYDSDFLPAAFHAGRRALLRDALPEHGVAVLFAAPVRVRSNDVDYEYHQDPDFYYYTGHTHPGAVLFVFKEPQTVDGVRADEFLFVQDRNPAQETWTGRIPSREEVAARSGVSAVRVADDLEGFDPDLSGAPAVWVDFPDDVDERKAPRGSAGWLVSRFRRLAESDGVTCDAYPLSRVNARLREVKTDGEIGLMQHAIDLTCRGFDEAMRAAEPGMREYQLENINEFMWRQDGSEHAGYPSIVGGGPNACVLHYETNRKKLLDGDIVVMDMGAEYHGYTADVTRSFPVNGRFTPEQKAIYELVLAAQEAGLSACVPGNAFNDPHRAAKKVIADGLIRLGIIGKASEVDAYFMHGTSHYLGLDVHDAGTYGSLKPRSVITVEPGIYIKEGSPCDRKWWNIGVRIEDDVLITDGGHRVMSDCIPKSVAEIEALMSRGSLFNKLNERP